MAGVGVAAKAQATGGVDALPGAVAATAMRAVPDASANRTGEARTGEADRTGDAAVLAPAVSSDEAALPDAPEASSSLAPAAGMQTASSLARTTPPIAGKYDTVILPGQTAARLTVHDKVVYGIKDSFSPISLFGWVLSAGYEQVTDGSPNYGVVPGNTQTGKSFAQRLGASAARSTSETLFSESVLAPILHEDPRYYAKTNRNFFYRVIYAGTRPLITRTDGGRTTVNLSSLGGNLAGAALTPAYYPPAQSRLHRGNEDLWRFGWRHRTRRPGK